MPIVGVLVLFMLLSYCVLLVNSRLLSDLIFSDLFGMLTHLVTVILVCGTLV